MRKKEIQPSKIRFHYATAPEARLQTAHGVWGGINPHGEIEMNFYHESDALPPHSEQLIAPDGSLGHEILPDEREEYDVNRYIHSRVLLNYNTARAVLEWLEDRVAALEEEGAPDMFGREPGIAQ